MGIVLVAACAACRAGVAFAMIRATPEETKPLAMVAQVAESPCAFWKSKVTFSPKEAVSASSKPCVASSSAACCTSWQMPTVNFSPLEAAATDAEAAVEDAAAEDAEEEPPQAERAAAAPQAAAAVRKERRVILRILMISSISSPCSQQDAALRADIVSGSNKVRFTLVKYITESLAKQSTFTRKRPLLSIQVKISINYFERLFRFF